MGGVFFTSSRRLIMLPKSRDGEGQRAARPR
jgi:hypothetical protein